MDTETAAQGGEPAAAVRRRILLVEDEPAWSSP